MERERLVVGQSYHARMWWDEQCKVKLISLGKVGTIYQEKAAVLAEGPEGSVRVFMISLVSLSPDGDGGADHYK